MEHIERIDYSRFTLERLQYWIDEGFKINKYKEPVLSEDERAMVFKLSEEQINEIKEQINETKEDLLKSVEYNERKIKAEAYKEFAEIIKDKWFDNRYDSPDVGFDDFIDNVLKELVGDNK